MCFLLIGRYRSQGMFRNAPRYPGNIFIAFKRTNLQMSSQITRRMKCKQTSMVSTYLSVDKYGSDYLSGLKQKTMEKSC